MKIVITTLLAFSHFLMSSNTWAQTISTYAGGGSSGLGDGGPATNATLDYFAGIAFDGLGNLYIADANRHRVRKVDASSGIITTVAGTGSGGFSGDAGAAIAAKLNRPGWVAVDRWGNIFIADGSNRRIRKVIAATGIISTVAGNGSSGSSPDGGPATNASFFGFQGIAIDTVGNLYIAETTNERIRKVDAVTNIISTYAGTGIAGFSGDNGPATLATINGVFGICFDKLGNLYIADRSNARVRRISVNDTITTIAGNGSAAYVSDGGLATATALDAFAVAVDDSGQIFIADYSNSRIRKIDLTNVAHTIAGSGVAGFSGDAGVATIAQIDRPEGVCFDPCQNLYIADFNNKRVRKVIFNPHSTTTILLSGVSSVTVGATVTVNATVSGAGSSYSIKWFRNSTLFSTTTLPTTTYVKGAGVDTITARVVPAVITCYDSAMSTVPHLVSVGTVDVLQLGYEHNNVHVYPNPAEHAITVTLDGANVRTVLVSDLLGREVMYKDGSSADMQLCIGHLPQGVYLIRVNGEYVRRIVKE